MVLVIVPLNTLIEDEIRHLRGKELSVGALQTKKSSTSFDFDDELEFNIGTECSNNEQNKDICDDDSRILKMGNLGFFSCTQKGLYHAGKVEKFL